MSDGEVREIVTSSAKAVTDVCRFGDPNLCQRMYGLGYGVVG
jgi:hypothetical protein